jgi:hypothetical protein
MTVPFSCSLFNFFFDFGFKFHSFSFSKIKFLRLKYHSITIDVRPWAALSAHGRHHGCRRARCRALAHLPSGWCCGGRIRAPAVTAGAGQRAKIVFSCSRIGRSIVGRSQTHECGNWDCGRAFSFLGIFVLNFRYCFFAVPISIYQCNIPSTQKPGLWYQAAVRVLKRKFAISWALPDVELRFGQWLLFSITEQVGLVRVLLSVDIMCISGEDLCIRDSFLLTYT